jgi:hypothetical protein
VVSIEVNLTSQPVPDASPFNNQQRINDQASAIDNEFVAWTLDLGPMVRLQKRIWSIAALTGAGVDLEAIVALVLVTEVAFSPAALAAIVPILVVQLILALRPARQLAHGGLARRHRAFLAFVVPPLPDRVELGRRWAKFCRGLCRPPRCRLSLRVARENGPRDRVRGR